MRAYLEGGPAHGRETDAHPACRAVRVPVRQRDGLFGAIVYARTDRRTAAGAVIFSANTPRKG